MDNIKLSFRLSLYFRIKTEIIYCLQEEEELDEDERKQAWFEYQQEKQSQVAKASQRKRVAEQKSSEQCTSAENSLPPAAVADPTVDDIMLSLPNLDYEGSE